MKDLNLGWVGKGAVIRVRFIFRRDPRLGRVFVAFHGCMTPDKLRSMKKRKILCARDLYNSFINCYHISRVRAKNVVHAKRPARPPAPGGGRADAQKA